MNIYDRSGIPEHLMQYFEAAEIGLEKTPDEYIRKLVEVFAEVKRVLNPDGTLWLNLGDCYAGAGGMGSVADNKAKRGMQVIRQYSRNKVLGMKSKDLIGIPWMAAFALRSDGWYLRQDIIWEKPNPMPESVKDRCTKAHEYVFLLSKNQKYYFNTIYEKATGYDVRKDTRFKGSKKYKDTGHTMAERGHERWQYKNLQEKGQTTHTLHENRAEGVEYLSPVRNKRSVWNVSTKPYKGAHFATFPEKLIEPMILAGCPVGGTVLDPFSGAGTIGVVAKKLHRKFIGIELNPEYIAIAERRIAGAQRRLIL